MDVISNLFIIEFVCFYTINRYNANSLVHRWKKDAVELCEATLVLKTKFILVCVN